MFQHELLPRIEIPTSMEGSDRVYHTPEGDFYSVTTIIKKVLGTKAIDNWRERVGDQRASEISTQATNRGHAIHSLAEAYLMNDPKWQSKSGPVNVFTFNQVKPFLTNHVEKVYGIELPLYSRVLKCGGQADLVATYNGIPSIIDFKTSLRPKQEKWIEHYFIQATTYSLMMEERYQMSCPQLVILMMVDSGGEPQVFIKHRKDYVKRVLEIFTKRD